MQRFYRVLLGLYPYDYRAAFGAEILAGLARLGAERRTAEVAGLLTGAAAEWIAKLTADPAVRGRALPDLRLMRPAGMPREIWFGRIPCSSDTSR